MHMENNSDIAIRFVARRRVDCSVGYSFFCFFKEYKKGGGGQKGFSNAEVGLQTNSVLR